MSDDSGNPRTPSTPDSDADQSSRGSLSRRGFLGASAAALGAGAIGGHLGSPPAASAQTASGASMPVGSGRPGRRILLRGGVVLSLDTNVGDFAKADVLIDGKRIVAVGPNLPTPDAVIDASNTIVMPGFVDTHHHQYQSVLRALLPNSLLLDGPDNYFEITDRIDPVFQPEDAYAGELIAAVSQINAGITTGVDISQVSNTPAHTDAMIQGLNDSGRRAVYAYTTGTGSGVEFPNDVFRLRDQYFSSNDQLVTLAMHVFFSPSFISEWIIAREVGAPISTHVVGDLFAPGTQIDILADAGLMGPDCEYIHVTRTSEANWQAIEDTGGKVSIAGPIEMTMRHGLPAIQAALDHNIRPSLSTDVEVTMSADMFTQMRQVFTLQRALINERARDGEENLPPLVTCRDVLEFATIEGAKCCQFDGKIGTLTPGKEADIIMLRTDAMNVVPVNSAPGAVVSFMDTSNVDTVLIAGKIMKWKGHLVGVDQDRVKRLATQARDRVLAAANYHPPLV